MFATPVEHRPSGVKNPIEMPKLAKAFGVDNGAGRTSHMQCAQLDVSSVTLNECRFYKP